jgi:hypothetical protein
MALTSLFNNLGLLIRPFLNYGMVSDVFQINAVGESLCFIGKIYLTSGLGTSKTISSAGGKIYFIPGTQVWASVGSTIRVGIQDINTGTGIEDGTYDVYDDLVQGTDTIPSDSVKEVLMSSGTKTINHGDIIGIIIEMTVRNGTDSLNINTTSVDGLTGNFPYITVDIGAGPTRNATNNHAPCIAIQFDDGTMGYFGDFMIPSSITSVTTLNSGSTPDEYALIFKVPFKCTINALYITAGEQDSGEDATVHLIQNPLTTVTNLVTTTLLATSVGLVGSIAGYTIIDIAETELQANTEYAISYRPTTTGNRTIQTITFLNSSFRLTFPFYLLGATRTDLGAFTTSSTVFPDFGFRINKLDDGASALVTNREAIQFSVVKPE